MSTDLKTTLVRGTCRVNFGLTIVAVVLAVAVLVPQQPPGVLELIHNAVAGLFVSYGLATPVLTTIALLGSSRLSRRAVRMTWASLALWLATAVAMLFAHS